MEVILRLFKVTVFIATWVLIIGLLAGDVWWENYNQWWLFSTLSGRITAVLIGLILLGAVTDILDGKNKLQELYAKEI